MILAIGLGGDPTVFQKVLNVWELAGLSNLRYALR
jgi:hypothetical protein